MNELSTCLGKLKLQNPVAVASGTFGFEYSDFFDLNCLGAYVTKTITPEPKAGNPVPRLYETEAGLLNSIGLQNPGLECFVSTSLPDLRKALQIPIIVSISASSINEFCHMVKVLDDTGMVDAYEINISCPNVENEGIAFGVDPFIVFELVKKLRLATQSVLIIKLSPNVTDIVTIAKSAYDAGADSLALINTLMGMAIDWKNGKSRIKKGIAGYSGQAIKPIALAQTYRVASAIDIPVLAMGGINNWKDALEFLFAGASAVALGTANFTNPRAVVDCITGLSDYVNNRQSSIDDIIGKISF